MWTFQGTIPVILPPSQGEMISIHPNNLITCNQGALPDINLPSPYNIGDFVSRQDLCAISLSNGKHVSLPARFFNINSKDQLTFHPPTSGANAGGYCHASRLALLNPFESSDEQYSVWFSDEMTPRQTWTWGGDFSRVASIRFFCWQNCWCSNHPNSKKLDLTKWPISKDAYITQAPDGKLHATYKPNGSGGKTRIVQEYGQVQSGHSHASYLTCGQTCGGPQSCTDSTFEDGCRCVLSATAQVQQVGLARVF